MSARTEETLAVLDQMHLLVAAARAYGPDHPSTERAAEVVAAAIREAAPPFSLQFVVQAVFRDRELVPVDVDRYDRAMALGEGLHRGGAQEITFNGPPNLEDLCLLGHELATPQTVTRRELDVLGFVTIGFREVPDAQAGSELETVEKETFVAAQLVLALRAARRAVEETRAADVAWPFAHGMEVVRRLERAVETHQAMAASTLEVAPGELDIARRSLLAAHHVATVCEGLGATKATSRSCIHAALIVAALGLEGREGLPFADAVRRARGAALAGLGAGGSDPHRLAVCAFLHDIATIESLELGQLIRLGYDLEKRRCPIGVEFNLTVADLLSWAVAQMGDGQGVAARWVRMRVMAAGAIPPGARVRLSDGRRAIVLGPGKSGDPQLPDVLVDGRREEAASPPSLEGTPLPAHMLPPPPPAPTRPKATVRRATPLDTNAATVRASRRASKTQPAAPPVPSRPVDSSPAAHAPTIPAMRIDSQAAHANTVSAQRAEPKTLASAAPDPRDTQRAPFIAVQEAAQPESTATKRGRRSSAKHRAVDATLQSRLASPSNAPYERSDDAPPPPPPVTEPKPSRKRSERAMDAIRRDPRRDSTGPRRIPIDETTLRRFEEITRPSAAARGDAGNLPPTKPAQKRPIIAREEPASGPDDRREASTSSDRLRAQRRRRGE